jgi:chemotaxis regulatin CheY-phosphate phosphatase CheZ
MSDSTYLQDAEFQQIEEFISRTTRGRAFLREHNRRAQTGVADDVRNLVAELRDLWKKQTDVNNMANRVQVLRHELQDMSASISHARREIAALKPADDGNDRFSTATNELDAIIVSTERASTEILTSAERILDMIGKLRDGGDPTELYNRVEGEVMEIFTACSFQDLTGQRTTKVINVLRYIEQRIGSMIGIWGVDSVRDGDIPAEPVDGRPDSHLMHGPTLHGIDQGEVDLLMSGFAAPRPAVSASADGPSETKAQPKPQPQPQPQKAAVEEEQAVPHPLDQSAIDALFG